MPWLQSKKKDKHNLILSVMSSFLAFIWEVLEEIFQRQVKVSILKTEGIIPQRLFVFLCNYGNLGATHSCNPH